MGQVTNICLVYKCTYIIVSKLLTVVILFQSNIVKWNYSPKIGCVVGNLLDVLFHGSGVIFSLYTWTKLVYKTRIRVVFLTFKICSFATSLRLIFVITLIIFISINAIYINRETKLQRCITINYLKYFFFICGSLL